MSASRQQVRAYRRTGSACRRYSSAYAHWSPSLIRETNSVSETPRESPSAVSLRGPALPDPLPRPPRPSTLRVPPRSRPPGPSPLCPDDGSPPPPFSSAHPSPLAFSFPLPFSLPPAPTPSIGDGAAPWRGPTRPPSGSASPPAGAPPPLPPLSRSSAAPTPGGTAPCRVARASCGPRCSGTCSGTCCSEALRPEVFPSAASRAGARCSGACREGAGGGSAVSRSEGAPCAGTWWASPEDSPCGGAPRSEPCPRFRCPSAPIAATSLHTLPAEHRVSVAQHRSSGARQADQSPSSGVQRTDVRTNRRPSTPPTTVTPHDGAPHDGGPPHDGDVPHHRDVSHQHTAQPEGTTPHHCLTPHRSTVPHCSLTQHRRITRHRTATRATRAPSPEAKPLSHRAPSPKAQPAPQPKASAPQNRGRSATEAPRSTAGHDTTRHNTSRHVTTRQVTTRRDATQRHNNGRARHGRSQHGGRTTTVALSARCGSAALPAGCPAAGWRRRPVAPRRAGTARRWLSPGAHR